MYIYIDESGTFSIPDRVGPSISGVGAVIIPDVTHDKLIEAFAELSSQWPRTANGELKGRLLTEDHFYDAVKLFAAHGVLFDFVAVDAGLHDKDEVAQHRDRQADKLRRAVTSAHKASLITEVLEIADKMQGLTPQQYLQSVSMNELIAAVMMTKVLYFAQARPLEIGRFRWRIDAKDRTRTTAERLWNTLVPAFLESRSMRHPDIHLIGADYSHHERFLSRIPADELRRRREAYGLNPAIEDGQGTDIRMVLREDLAFEDSCMSVGLQIADLMVSLAARALRGHIKRRAWWNLGNLMLRPIPPAEVIHLICLYSDGRGWRPSPPYYDVLRHLRRTSKSLLVEDNDEALKSAS